MVDLKVGDEVRVFDINGRRMGQPDGGWQGTVTKVGRTLVYVDYGHRNGQFRIDTGRANDSYGHRYFKTLEQAASDARLSHALARLKGGPVRLESGHRLTVEQIERLLRRLSACPLPRPPTRSRSSPPGGRTAAAGGSLSNYWPR